jgi:hypothetical protein
LKTIAKELSLLLSFNRQSQIPNSSHLADHFPLRHHEGCVFNRSSALADAMPLLEVTVTVSDRPLPRGVVRFLREAQERIELFQAGAHVPGFVPSNYEAAYRFLRALVQSPLLRGQTFCEWGSGFGVVASLASMLEFEASGIEIEGMLIDEARRLADDFGLSVEFGHGSFVPRGAENLVHHGGSYSWLTTEGDYAYEDLGLTLSDVDLVFAYPWPDEEHVVEELFERYAGTGALLATHHGGEQFRLQRKKRSRAKGSSRRER